LVREHAAWALGRLGGPEAHAALRAARAGESDAEVRAAIDAALATFDRPTGAGGAGEPHAKMAEGHAHDGTT
jgi:epoxyqueuosine reductase